MKRLLLAEGWQLASTPPGAIEEPDALSTSVTEWHDAQVPGTVASSLHADLEARGTYDAHDWWYRTTFIAPASASSARCHLCFEGLATLADVWLNGRRILESRNMFLGHRVDVTGLLRDVNQLAIRFASLDAALEARRPRPRWKTALVESQNLRWFRTTLLGRMPGWSPLVAPVGPWGPIALEYEHDVGITDFELQAWAENGAGRVQLRAVATWAEGGPIEGARLRIDGVAHGLELLQGPEARIEGTISIPDAPLWWPHTHGDPRLLPWRLELLAGGRWHEVREGRLGFKEMALDTRDGAVRFSVNGSVAFLRGACWTTVDIRALRGTRAELERALKTARDGGANVLRVGGTMTYESDDFYDLCDELGLLVWQDFMFANMDYPVADPAFRASIEAEARHQLHRLQGHACIAAYCGGSEVAQQAAMMGLPAAQWSNDFFSRTLPDLCAALHGRIPYFPSSPWGGALPFHVGSGIAHYYGVGAYRRPLADVKRAGVRFATECLGFSNIPEPAAIRELMSTEAPAPHHPRWKAGVPRDNGSGWDFEDIRDHYVKRLFRLDPVELRSQDLPRYFALGRVTSGEVMRRVFAEWRAQASGCGGGLVWFLRDLRPGAGWGIVDSAGRPKAAWWFLRRAWAARSVHLTDEGLDGMALHVVNETSRPLDAVVEIEAYRDGRTAVAAAKTDVRLPAWGGLTRSTDAVFGRFTDLNHCYRFGPPPCDAIAARLRDRATGEVLSEDFLFPQGMDLPPSRDADVRMDAVSQPGGTVELSIHSDVLLVGANLSCGGFDPDDNYFHVAPARAKRLLLRPSASMPESIDLSLDAANLARPISLRWSVAGSGRGVS